MTRTEVRSIVIEELMEVQKAIGAPFVSIASDTRPIGDLSGFDSQVAEDATATILGKLGADADTKCPFTVKEAGAYLSLERVVDRFCQAAGVMEE